MRCYDCGRRLWVCVASGAAKEIGGGLCVGLSIGAVVGSFLALIVNTIGGF